MVCLCFLSPLYCKPNSIDLYKLVGSQHLNPEAIFSGFRGLASNNKCFKIFILLG